MVRTMEHIMKYNININQLALSDGELDLIDSAILDYLYFICNSKNKKISDKRINGYTWVQYQRMINDMPLLRINSRGAITRRIHKIEKEGFIRIDKKIDNRMYIELTDKIDTLLMKVNSPVDESEHDNNTIDNTNIYTPYIAKQSFADHKTLIYLIGCFRGINPSYKIMYSNNTQKHALARLLKEHGLDKIKSVLEVLPDTNKLKYAPTITTPLELETKLGSWLAYMQKNKPNKVIKL